MNKVGQYVVVAAVLCLLSEWSLGQRVDWNKLSVKPYCIWNADSFIQIEHDEVSLSSRGFRELDRLAEYLVANPKIVIAIGKRWSQSAAMNYLNMKGLMLVREYLVERVGKWDRIVIDRHIPKNDPSTQGIIFCTMMIRD